jgi:hypothetical protein
MSDEGKLLGLFGRLEPQQQDKLIAFAEFLTGGAPGEAAASAPLAIPRPAGETVTMAIRRLTRTYPMLDRKRLMGEASRFMAQHALEGRPAIEVIDELERVFARHYQMMREQGDRRDEG